MSRISLPFFLIALFATPLTASEAVIEHLVATASGHEVSVHFTLSHAFEREQTIQGLQSGVPTSLSYVVEIFRDRPLWIDEGVARAHIEVIATFNSVTREYLMNYRRDRKLVRSETFSDLPSLQRAMTTIDEPNIFDAGKRAPYKLKVRVKADLMRGWLLYVVPWEVSTRWQEVRVGMREAAP